MIEISRNDAQVNGLKTYFTGKVCPKGHLSERWVSTRACITCVKERTNKWKCDNPEKVKEGKSRWNSSNPEKIKDHKSKARNKDNARVKRRRKENPVPYMIHQAKGRAKKLSIPFDITKDDITIPEFCPVLGIPIFSGDGTSTNNSPSIDRIIPSLGYVRGNIVVVSMRANRIKNDSTVEELSKILQFYQSLTHQKLPDMMH